MSRRAGRSRCPSGVRIFRPKRSTSRSSGGCPGSTTSRATWSLSRIGTPSAPKNFAAVDLPLAIPPVSPTRYGRVLMRSMQRGREAEIASDDGLPEHQHQPAGAREEWPERYGCRAALTSQHDQRQADDRADSRSDQDDRQKHLPAEPSTQRREELEVAVAHPVLTGEEAEQMIDAPQAHVTRHGPDHARSGVHRYGQTSGLRAPQTEKQAKPQEWKCQAVGQQLMIDVDESERNQVPGENQGCAG